MCNSHGGGGIGLKPVYAADAVLNVNNGVIKTGSINGKVNGVDITDGSISNGTFEGTVTLTGANIKTAIDGVDISMAKVGSDHTSLTIGKLAENTQKISYDADKGTKVDGHLSISSNGGITIGDENSEHYVSIGNESVHATNAVLADKVISAGINTRMENGNVVAQNGLYIGYDGYDIAGVTYDNSRFAVKGADGSFKAANGAFTVEGNGKTVVTGGHGSITINPSDEGILYTRTVGGVTQTIQIDSGWVEASEYVEAPKFIVDNKNIFQHNNLTVEGNGDDGKPQFVRIGGGNISASGDVNVVGNLWVGGTNGIKTDKIDEATDGAGVTVAGVLLKDNGISAAGGKFKVDGDTGDVTTTGNIQGKDITATGALKSDSLSVTNNATVGGTLEVTKDTTLNGALNAKGKATFGAAAGALTEIDGDKLKTGVITTEAAQESHIGGVKMQNGKITASNMEITGAISLNDLKVNNKLAVGTFGVTTAGVVTGVTSINDVAVSKQGTGLTIGSATVGDSNPFSSQGYTVDATGNVSAKDIIAGKYNGNEITADKKFNGVGLDGGNVKATKVTAATITDDNGFTATGGNVTAKNIQADTGTIAGVNFAAGGSVSGISELTATTIKDGAGTIITGGNVESKTATIGAINIDNETIEGSSANGLSIEGVKIKDGVMSSVVSIDAAKATIGGVNTLDNTGLTVKTGSKVQVGTNTVIEDGSVKVSQKTSLTDQSLHLNDTNKWTQAGGLVADKATVNGIALGTDSKGKATFSDAAGKTTTIDGDKITTGTITADELLIDKISLGKDGSDNISIDKDGDVTTKGEIRITDAAGNVMTKLAKDSATFGNDVANQTVIEKGTVRAKAKSEANQQAGLTFNETGLTVSGQNAEGKTSSFSFNAKTGANTFISQDGTFTTINGSSVRSYNSATGAGHLNGATLNLWKDADNSTYMTAGGATFNGAAGEKGGKVTTINGGMISTDTLNVERINLGEDILDSNGNPHGSNLSMDKQGNFSAAGGNFKVTGGSGADKGAFTNTVGNTTLQTDNAGASMSYDNTGADGGVKSEVAVEANKATVAAGDKASFVAAADNGGTATITGGTQTVTTTDKGTVFENSDHKTAFVENGATNTIINGNEITTGKITTDQLVITGQGNAHGNGSIAFGGNGTIKSDINDGTTNGKNTSFETTLDGVNTKVTNGTTTTENKVTAEGNSNTVKQDDTHKSEFNQGLTSIGGVVTNGEIKVAQKLDGATGLLTNEVTDANGSSKLEQSGTGLTYTDSANAGNATRIDSSDVSIGSKTDPDKRINLSDLGQIDELDKELTGRDEYKNNPTAVGGINAEAAIRREEVARLDGRINDVNDRVNKVGAMAAAIASLKSIGYDPQAPSEFSIGLGQYKGETGVAMGFFHYPNKNFMINVSLSTACGETMGGIGATWRFGHKSPQKLLEEQREAQAKKELAAAEKYQAAAKLAKEAQERAEYAAKLARQAQVSADNAKAAADATQAKHFG